MRGDGVGVGDIDEVPGDAWKTGDTAIVDDGRGTWMEHDTGMVGGLEVIERDATAEPSGDRVCVAHYTRGEHGACDVHRVGSGGAHGMRGDGVGVGDIGEVPGDAWKTGDTASGDDGRGAGRERDAGVVGGLGIVDRDATAEPSRDRLGVGDDPRGEHGVCDVHGAGSGGAHGSRGDGVGVGDIGEVPGDAWRSGDTASGSDSRGAENERHAGMVDGLGVIERDATAEPSGDRLGVVDDPRGEHGACVIHGAGTGGTHGMRGDGVGVGDISEVSGDAWRSGDTASGDHIKSAWQQQHAGNFG